MSSTSGEFGSACTAATVNVITPALEVMDTVTSRRESRSKPPHSSNNKKLKKKVP